MIYKTTISVTGQYYIEVEANDDYEAEQKAIQEAKKMYSEIGIIEPEFEIDVVEEVLE